MADIVDSSLHFIDLNIEAHKTNLTADTFVYYSYTNSQQDATVYQNLLFHVYMKLVSGYTSPIIRSLKLH